jgi:5-hydroxyisourate hydrolase-like protein (transthyretin family)
MTHGSPLRRRISVLAAALVASTGLVAVAATNLGPLDGSQTIAEALRGPKDCPAELVLRTDGAPASCAHADEAPPGVDINKPVPTRVLEAREGPFEAAAEAAQDQGIPVPAVAAAVTDRVVCDGDGTSGYRTQSMYVVEAGQPNRYAAVADQIKQWSAGIDQIFNLSAAKTGGVRNVRFVTASNGDGTCSPTVLNVTVPAGSLASFSSSINALVAMGYNSGARKYSVWADTSGKGICGIAQTYPYSTPAGQDNPNNGAYPQFARTDAPCWGSGQSVEAHELSHTLGSVMPDAPHATSNGHCYDESDRMCYADGGGKAMQQICNFDQEILFDCRDDDYYSTYPPAGSYLDTHWNTADSRFLIGGGDGTGGGSAGVPTRLGGTMAVNNPAIPGLPTQVAMNLELPAGRTTNTVWSSSRADCVFADKTATQTTVTCDAKAATAATITATTTDSAGETLIRKGSLTFTTTARPAASRVAIDATTTGTYTACPTGKAYLSATVTDTASGVGVKGVPVTFMRTVGTAAPVAAGTAITDADGRAVAKTATAVLAGSYTAKTTTATAFGSVTSAALTAAVSASACTTALTGDADTTTVQAGDPVKVTGTLTRTLPGGSTSPAAGEIVRVYSQNTGASNWTVAGTATTGPDGTYAVTIKPLTSAILQARYTARTGFGASTAPSTAITVNPWATALTTSATPTSLMAGAAVTVTGSLTQSDGTTATPMAATALSVTYPLAGGKTAVASAKTSATGAYMVKVLPTGPGTVTVKYVGKPGWPAATATTSLAVGTWDTTLTSAATPADVMAGTGVTLAGYLTQTDGTTTTPVASAPVNITVPVGGGKTTVVKATTTSTGRYSTLIKPLATGNVTVAYAGKPGWAASSTTTPVTIRNWTSALTMTATRNATDGYVTATGRLTSTNTSNQTLPKSGAIVEVTYQVSAIKTAVVRATTTTTGTYTVKFKPGVSGTVTARYLGTPGWGAATAPAATITIP